VISSRNKEANHRNLALDMIIKAVCGAARKRYEVRSASVSSQVSKEEGGSDNFRHQS
jgi:hypothetical protein